MNRMRGELWEIGSTITDSQLASHQKKNPPGVNRRALLDCKTRLHTRCTQAGERCRIAMRITRNENSSAFARYRTDAPPIIASQ
jgi:hypothetical protein